MFKLGVHFEKNSFDQNWLSGNSIKETKHNKTLP